MMSDFEFANGIRISAQRRIRESEKKWGVRFVDTRIAHFSPLHLLLN